MVRAIRQHVTIGPGGTVQVRRPDLPSGIGADIIILFEAGPASETSLRPLASFSGAAGDLFGTTPEAMQAYVRELRDELT